MDSLQKNIIAYIFSRNLKLGDRGADIRELQKYLNNSGFVLATKGAGSLSKETNFFGWATRKALAKFQAAHKKEILIPAGLKKEREFLAI